mgnify:CR=1 FL=1
MAQVRAFSEQRFEPLITSVAQGFFGMASRDEAKLPELRAAVNYHTRPTRTQRC